MTVQSTELHVVAYPRDQVRPENFELVTVELAHPVWDRCSCGTPDLGRSRAPAAAARESARRVLPPPLHCMHRWSILTIGEIVDSQAPGFAVGDTVWHSQCWREYAVVDAGVAQMNGLGTLRVLDTTVTPSQWYLAPLGVMG